MRGRASNFLGIYIGIREVRGVLSDEIGAVLAQSRIRIEDKPCIEQEPELLWQKVISCLKELVPSASEVAALGVSSTPGAIIPVDADGKALHPAIVGEDSRAAVEAKLINEKGENFIKKSGYRFEPSSALARILWLKRQKAEIYRKTRKFINVSDFIVGKLTGEFFVTDTSNAIHAGYDTIDLRWPAFIREVGLLQETLPKVVKPGETVGSVQKSFANQIGLSGPAEVIAGTTDELTLLISSGVTLPGQWNSHLGRKLRVAGVSSKLIKDKLFRFYSLLHPEGSWIARGESSVGRESLEQRFAGENLREMEEHMTARPAKNGISNGPSSLIVYPLTQQGEKFPFLNPDAQGFIIGKPHDKYDLYSGYLEGIAFVEKWIFEFLEELGFEMSEEIYVTGQGNPHWLQIRANVLEKVLIKPETGSPETGTAILSAGNTFFSNLAEAVKSMVRIEKHVEPQPHICDTYHGKYRKFRRVCRAIGYE
jgi:xylulokinase